jgi:hypothetical protein
MRDSEDYRVSLLPSFRTVDMSGCGWPDRVTGRSAMGGCCPWRSSGPRYRCAPEEPVRIGLMTSGGAS